MHTYIRTLWNCDTQCHDAPHVTTRFHLIQVSTHSHVFLLQVPEGSVAFPILPPSSPVWRRRGILGTVPYEIWWRAHPSKHHVCEWHSKWFTMCGPETLVPQRLSRGWKNKSHHFFWRCEFGCRETLESTRQLLFTVWCLATQHPCLLDKDYSRNSMVLVEKCLRDSGISTSAL